MGADLLEIQMRRAEVLDNVPHADDIKGTASEILIQEVTLDGFETELPLGEPDPFASDIDSRDSVEPVPYEVEEKAISAPDLKQAPMPGRVKKSLQYVQSKTEVFRVDQPVGEIVAVFRPAEVLVAVQVKEFLICEFGIRKDQTAIATS
jgi:hypothetical protein